MNFDEIKTNIPYLNNFSNQEIELTDLIIYQNRIRSGINNAMICVPFACCCFEKEKEETELHILINKQNSSTKNWIYLLMIIGYLGIAISIGIQIYALTQVRK